jgi:hypothetical protein
VLLNWHIFQRWDPKLSTSTSSIITSGSTSALALLSKVLPISTSEQLACWYIHQATHTEHLSQAQEGSAALLVSSHASSIPIE